MEQRMPWLLAGEDAVEHHHMEVHVQIDAGAKSLDVRHRAAPSLAEPTLLGPPQVSREDRLDEDAGECRKHVRLERRERAKFPRQREHPLPDRHSGQNAID